jgi:hypothetical protein
VWSKEAQSIDAVADGQKYARSSYFNIKFGVLEIVLYTYVGKSTAKKQHAPWEKSTKSTSLKKKSPLFPRYILQTYHEI